ncbi:Activating signal cointegrator 1 [Ananas comosus]|uniref:Activating signal cointegrator 1 n=1 Tax=Ananas comosus TaxID=4615 RepID=A0A199VRF4_ANACO|nr:Activating signal cointegrator 1 [Ananas comosus]
MDSSGEWLEKALRELSGKIEEGLDLDADLISGLVSFCELAPPLDAADYLRNIIGVEAGKDVIQEYLRRRGHADSSNSNGDAQTSQLQAYVKPPADGNSVTTKKQARSAKETRQKDAKSSETQNTKSQSERSQINSKKKKGGKAISLAEAAKGSVVFQQGKPCSCQARRHKLVSNCLSCGKIVCEQEGEGPCSFCGALVLREGSTYAGLSDVTVPLSEAEAVAEAYARRLVEYDRNSAARTKVIDDQSDYYEIEGNSWLSPEEKATLKKKQQEIEEAANAQKGKVIVTFDLVGRKVILNKDEASELESEYNILRPPEERELNRIKPNPTVRVQPMFVDTGPLKKSAKGKKSTRLAKGLCLEISGRVQHDERELHPFLNGGSEDGSFSSRGFEKGREGDDYECSLDYN